MKTGDTIWLWLAVRRLPGVEAQMVVISACRHEQNVARRAPARDVAGLEHHIEAQRSHVEIPDAVDVPGPEVDVPHSDLGIDRALGRRHRVHRPLRAAHGAAFTTRSGIWKGSEVRKPRSTGWV